MSGGEASGRASLRARDEPIRTDASVEVSVVIVTRDGRERLEPCLRSIAPALERLSAEVIVIDNGSRHSCAPWIHSWWPQVVVIELSENLGFARACNLGAERARGEFVIFLNDDTVVTSAWATSLGAALRQWPEVVIAGGLTLFQSRPDLVNSAGIRIAVSGAGRDIGFGLSRHTVNLRPRDVPGVSGVSMAVRREWFLGTGGFDDGFFMYFEDSDLCLRAWLEGHRIRFVPESVVQHAFGGTAGSPRSRWRYHYGTRNRLLIAFKAYDWYLVPLAWLLSVAQDTAVVAAFLLRRQWRAAGVSALGKFQGTLAALAVLPQYRSRRRQVRIRQRRTLRELRSLGVIDPISVSVREFVQRRRQL